MPRTEFARQEGLLPDSIDVAVFPPMNQPDWMVVVRVTTTDDEKRTLHMPISNEEIDALAVNLDGSLIRAVERYTLIKILAGGGFDRLYEREKIEESEPLLSRLARRDA